MGKNKINAVQITKAAGAKAGKAGRVWRVPCAASTYMTWMGMERDTERD